MERESSVEDFLKKIVDSSKLADFTGSVVWNTPVTSPLAPPPGFQTTAAPSWNPIPLAPLPPPAWPDNTLIREILVRMDKELAEALKLVLKRLDKIDAVVERIEQAGRYSS